MPATHFIMHLSYRTFTRWGIVIHTYRPFDDVLAKHTNVPEKFRYLSNTGILSMDDVTFAHCVDHNLLVASTRYLSKLPYPSIITLPVSNTRFLWVHKYFDPYKITSRNANVFYQLPHHVKIPSGF